MAYEHPVTQGSDAWHRLRFGRPTASEFDQLLTPSFALRTGDMPRTYLYRKIAEHLLGKSLDQGGSWAMDQGSLLESEAIPYYEFTQGVKVRRIGFVTSDDFRIGCSPDGLLDPDGGIEAKSPLPHTHIRYLTEGGLPKEYVCQVHGSMYVTGRKWWAFLSYCRRLPPHIVRVERDEKVIAVIHEAVTKFLAEFDRTLELIQAKAA
jgi:hypothetical protein